jgi:hypothetical protein
MCFYISTVIREMSNMPCKKYLSGSKNDHFTSLSRASSTVRCRGSKNDKSKNKLKQVSGSCQKLALQLKNTYVEGSSHNFATGPNYATVKMFPAFYGT